MKWHFPSYNNGDDIQGIRDGDIELFDRYRYASVVRESIQNSMDAQFDKNKPVVVEFEFFDLKKGDYRDLFNVENHLRACAKYNGSNEDDKEYFDAMIRSLKVRPDRVEILRITDYNTIGMDANGSYKVFALARNISTKQSKSSAGSKGMGKAAYFSLSYLRSILVSSRTQDNQCLFQGISRLSMHQMNGELLKYKGFFGLEDLKPITDHDITPPLFHRSEPGTSIFILGLWDDDDRIIEMRKALLNSFWLAILEKQLIVSINNETIDHSNVYEHIISIWESPAESKQYNVGGNPRPYIETWMQEGKSQSFSDNLPHLGSVRCVFAKHHDYSNLVAFFRKSKMLIQKQPILYKGYCGVLLCDDEQGNEYLKKLENARHDKWESGNWSNNRKFAKTILKELNDFVKESFEQFAGSNEEKEISIPKLAELLGVHGTRYEGAQGNQPGKNKGLSKPRKKTPVNGGKNKSHDKKLNNVYSYVTTLDDGGLVYNITIEANQDIEAAKFEVLAGGDSEKLTNDNRIPLKSISEGKIEENEFVVDLVEGVNRFQVMLDDKRKHTLMIKAIAL